MSSSDLSPLSSPPSSDAEPPPTLKPLKTLKLSKGKLTAARTTKKSTPSSPEPDPDDREPSPPHEYVLADNADIPILVVFRARFADAFPKNVHHFGPQDLEQGVVASTPSEQVDNLLCALLGLVLNRKKPPERGHHSRALEEAMGTQRAQWPKSWEGKNPLHGSQSFETMTPTQRLQLLRTLMTWCLNSSEVIRGMIAESYKQARHDDDLNQPLSVQPWGMDGKKRRYWLIEGQNDTHFRLYRQSPAKGNEDKWLSIAGTIDELKAVAEQLQREGSQAGRRLADRFMAAIPRLEGSEERRKRREYRQARRAAFTRPEPGFSLYEGRTRGKRMKYTFSDDEDDGSDSVGVRRSARQSGIITPAEASGPTVTASGRQVRSRFGRSYGEQVVNGQTERSGLSHEVGLEDGSDSELAPRTDGRPRRSGNGKFNSRSGRGDDSDVDMGEDDDPEPSGEEWDGDDEDVEGKFDEDESEDNDEDDFDNEAEPKSLVVTLKYRKLPNPGSRPELERVYDNDAMEVDQPRSRTPQQSSSPVAPMPSAPTEAANGALVSSEPPTPPAHESETATTATTLPSISSLVNPPSPPKFVPPPTQHTNHDQQSPTKLHTPELLPNPVSSMPPHPSAQTTTLPSISAANGFTPALLQQPIPEDSVAHDIAKPTLDSHPSPAVPRLTGYSSPPAQGQFTLPQRSPPPVPTALLSILQQAPPAQQQRAGSGGGSGAGTDGR